MGGRWQPGSRVQGAEGVGGDLGLLELSWGTSVRWGFPEPGPDPWWQWRSGGVAVALRARHGNRRYGIGAQAGTSRGRSAPEAKELEPKYWEHQNRCFGCQPTTWVLAATGFDGPNKDAAWIYIY